MPFANNMIVTVNVSKNKRNEYSFSLKKRGNKRAAQNLSFHNNKRPGFMIYFNIKQSSDLVFQPVPSDAIWAAPDTNGWPASPNCPAVAPPPWSELVPLSVENGGKQLIVYFRNTNQGVHFPFALRFLGPNGPVNYDPIGDGHNGGRL